MSIYIMNDRYHSTPQNVHGVRIYDVPNRAEPFSEAKKVNK